VKYTFKTEIYKVGINPVVDVPNKISSKMKPVKGYIPVKGMINAHAFHQTLCPIKNGPYRLYVNGPMMKGGEVELGSKANFEIEYDDRPPKDAIAMPVNLEKRLKKEKLLRVFNVLTPSRQKEIFKYLHSLKTEDAKERNIEKVIAGLKKEQRP
jgi:hypothetical protein